MRLWLISGRWSWLRLVILCYIAQALYLASFEPQVFESLPRLLLEVTRTTLVILLLFLLVRLWSRRRHSKGSE